MVKINYIYFVIFLIFFGGCSAKYNSIVEGDLKLFEENRELIERVDSYFTYMQRGNHSDIKRLYNEYEVPYFSHLYSFDEYRKYMQHSKGVSRFEIVSISIDPKNGSKYIVSLRKMGDEQDKYGIISKWVLFDSEYYHILQNMMLLPLMD